MNKTVQVINKMIEYYMNDPHQVNHFLKVYGFARSISEMEDIDEEMKEVLSVSSIMHDIGIRNSIQKYNSSAGKYQEIEGPPEAKKILLNMKYDDKFIDRVCYLIANHHTYENIEGIDYQILIESDFLVNIYENNMKEIKRNKIYNKIFKTNSGRKIFRDLYGI